MVVQSMLYSASLHLDALQRIHGVTQPTLPTAQQLQLKGSVMNQIREKLSTVNKSNMRNEWVDEILMGILYLAANENTAHIGPPETGPFIAPFRSLQLMVFYGSCEFHPLHWQAAQNIILQRGGLSTVKLYGLAWLISISGLIFAINANCKPVFPLVSPMGKPFVYRAPLQALSIRTPARHAALRNQGFQQLALLDPPVKGNIIRILLDLSEITQALQVFAGQPCGAALLTQIGDARAGVLHHLCNLPNHTDRPNAILHKRQCTTKEQGMSIAIYLICRKAALLYAASVVMPLPKTSMLRHKTTADIYSEIIQLDVPRKSRYQCEILLWCSIIAGICADAVPDIRAWFVEEARRYCEVLRIASWDEFHVFLESFAWLNCASDEAGMVIWHEIEGHIESGKAVQSNTIHAESKDIIP
ncbi:hypothetical protein BDW69DRAFT_120008 [Aspergillus filifer]